MTRFAFIIHPLDIRDVARKYAFTRYLPGRLLETALRWMKPQNCGQIRGVRSLTGAETEGWLIGCPLTARQLLHGNAEYALRRIVEACEMASELGAEIVGLGAYTAIVGDKGISVAERVAIGVTTGNSYTAATGLEAALLGAERMGHNPAECTAAVVGATGSIGRVSAKLLAPQVGRLILVGRRREALEALREEMATPAQVVIETDIGRGLREAEIIITVTSALEAVIEPEHLKPGAVVCDIARPRDVSPRVAKERDDVLVIEGGAVAPPGEPISEFDFGFPPGLFYACMAETMILALEGRTEDYSLGPELREEQVQEMRALARKHGFRLAGFRSFERALSDTEIEAIRQRAAARAKAIAS